MVSLGYRFRSSRKDEFLSWNLGLKEYNVKSPKERLRLYREFVYARGGVDLGKARFWMHCPSQNRWSASSSAPGFSPMPGSSDQRSSSARGLNSSGTS